MADDTGKTYAAGVPDAKPDPTANVFDLVTAASLRQDDLRDAERRYNDLRDTHSKETAYLRESYQSQAAQREREYQEKLAIKESSRLDSIRQIDREDGNQKAIAAQTAITTLANSTIALKDTLQLQVQNTAVAVENKQAAFQKDVNDRISHLELQYSEGKGKADVREPANEELIKLVRELASQKSQDTGQSVGMKNMGAWIVAGILGVFVVLGGIATIIGVGVALYMASRGG